MWMVTFLSRHLESHLSRKHLNIDLRSGGCEEPASALLICGRVPGEGFAEMLPSHATSKHRQFSGPVPLGHQAIQARCCRIEVNISVFGSHDLSWRTLAFGGRGVDLQKLSCHTASHGRLCGRTYCGYCAHDWVPSTLPGHKTPVLG